MFKQFETIGRNIELLYRGYLLRKLEEHGVEIKTRVQVMAIQSNGAWIQEISGEEYLVPADWVVLARGIAPSNELAKAIKELDPIVIGDALQPRKIINAIEEGYRVASAIGSS